MPGGRPTTKAAPIFGQRLAALRTARGLSQAELAKHLGTTRSAIVYFERTASNPNAEFISKAAGFFGVSFDELMGSPAKAPRKPGPPSHFEQLAERLAALPRARQKIAAQMIEGLLVKAS